MAERDKTPKKGTFGLLGWAAKKLLSSVPGWIGIGAGLIAGVPMASENGAIAGFMLGGVVGLTATMMAFLAAAGIKNAQYAEAKAAADAAEKFRMEREGTLLEKLKAVGLDDDAGVLTKLLEARDAIFKRCDDPDVDEKTGAPTLELVAKIANSALHRSEELLDLTRRITDPLLTSPEGAEEAVEACRADLVRAYQAVADSRSRILLFREPNSEVFADDADKPALGSLAEQLEEETSVLEGIDRRLRGLDLGPEISPAGSQDTSVTTTSAERALE